MFRNSKHLGRWLAIAVAIGLLCSAVALAGKPSKPPGSNGGGVIYFSWNGDLYTMNDDGSKVVQVADFPYEYGPWGDPSRQLHAGKRWFVQTKDVLGEFYPDFHPNGVRKDFANRRVLVALSDAGDVVELPIAADLEPLEAPKWTVGDGCLSWAGRRWDIDLQSESYATVLEGGLYVTPLAFDAGNVSGVAAPSSLLVPFVPLVPSNARRQFNDFTDGPDMYNHDWAPDGTQFVFDAVSAQELRIGDVETGEFDVLFSDLGADNVGSARWSPAGNKIMFNYDPDLGHGRAMTINVDGTRLTMLARGTPEWSVSMGVWSPTGSHLLYQHWDHWEADSYIIRAKASGTDARRITDESMGAGMQSPRAIGWR